MDAHKRRQIASGDFRKAGTVGRLPAGASGERALIGVMAACARTWIVCAKYADRRMCIRDEPTASR
jgi:hypothetical protein